MIVMDGLVSIYAMLDPITDFVCLYAFFGG
jgi:hypothetical protein